ncbi:helix-turn-helix domain-containing protein [Streptomyces sudanensis]|uniref:helix-turn-helix domain-containing protein n=1 Tax=Streptomyces sudanensis TaxID=436397 RepID=UPI0020CD859C|nr:helix-turn-helix domain-containing protein [Streptomyces sudanensis]MCP9958668.1 helix-turn-helix domain-containing protein [Streptomyces sudanensis]MCQ0000837.1 helix-turn-helix domain-containing protein [Streptomyces sudanensis]
MGLAERRRALGYSQERLAQAVGVDRTTVGRWESGRITPQPAQRRRLATTLDLSLRELDVLLSPPRAGQGAAGRQVDAVPSAGDLDEMIRREFLRLLTVSGALAALSDDEAQALTSEFLQAAPSDFTQMNAHLWQVYRLARTKATLRPVIRDQLAALGRAASGSHPRPLLHAAADLLQLAGEVAFDANRHTEAAASYALAASAGKDTRAYDLWACALVRHAYVDMAEHRNRQAVQLLDMARKLAERGDTALPTRHWAASVQAQAYAGLGDLAACERALDHAEQVRELPPGSANGGWLRFDGSRLAEERGARYVRLGRLDLAEKALGEALRQAALAPERSFRRRGAVLADLAAVGVRRGDPEQAVAYGGEAVELAEASASGYVARRLQELCHELAPLGRDPRVAELKARIVALDTP